jgi:hypothetical protein
MQLGEALGKVFRDTTSQVQKPWVNLVSACVKDARDLPGTLSRGHALCRQIALVLYAVAGPR